jgi:hypothetical protein
MVIWNGLGFLVALIGIAVLVLTEYFSESITGDPQFYQAHRWVILVGMLIAAALTFGLHRLLQRQKPRIVIDKESGREVSLLPTHSLFFIPVKWWPAVFVALGFAMMFVTAKT